MRTEPILLDRANRLERLAVVGTCDDVRAAAFRARPDAIGEHVRAVVVERRMRGPGPPTDTAAGSGDGDDGRRTARGGGGGGRRRPPHCPGGGSHAKSITLRIPSCASISPKPRFTSSSVSL